MKRIAFLVVVVATVAGVVASMAPASGRADDEAVPIFGIKIPPGYRDWRLISVAHEEGNLNSFAAILGNDVAIKAYREGKLPYPDGTIIAALHYGHVPSEENDRVFGDPQSFVPDSLTSTRTANLATRRCSKPAPLATRRLLATLSSHGTHLDTEDSSKKEFSGQPIATVYGVG
jgi:hypothetical protein